MLKWIGVAILGYIIYISFDSVETGRESGNQVDNKVAATKIKEDTKPRLFLWVIG